jgi:hypothetical protein
VVAPSRAAAARPRAARRTARAGQGRASASSLTAVVPSASLIVTLPMNLLPANLPLTVHERPAAHVGFLPLPVSATVPAL